MSDNDQVRGAVAPTRGLGQVAVRYGDQPVRLCPSMMCGFAEQATLDIVPTPQPITPRSRLMRGLLLPALVRRWWGSGYAEVRYLPQFRGDHCPDCGRRLESACPSCNKQLVSTRDSHCRHCGTQFPWSRLREGRFELLTDWKGQAKHIATIKSYGAEVYLLQHSIERLKIDAIACGDDDEGRMRGDAASAIRYEGGAEIEDESLKQRAKDAAWRTGPGNLPVQAILHCALTDSEMRTSSERVTAAVSQTLALASSEGIREVAFPAFGTGTGGLTPAAAAGAMAAAMHDFLPAPDKTAPTSLVVVLYREGLTDDFAFAFKESLKEHHDDD